MKYVWNGSTRVARVTGSLTTTLRTQRLRVYPGMNLVSLAVSLVGADVRRLMLSDPTLVSSAATIQSVQRWNAAGFGWVTVTTNEALAAGTVLWLKVSTNTTLSLTGTYAEPANQALPPGVNFVSGWGLQPIHLSSSLSPLSSTAAWAYNNQTKAWRKRLTGELQTISDVPAMLTPGDALFARSEVLATLTVPESALQVRYYHQDHLGSSSVLTDAAGALVNETANYAFGFARNEFLPRNLREPYGFTQKERDGESGLNYFEARFQVATVGRFASVDCLSVTMKASQLSDPQGLSFYAYCRSRPFVRDDPTGCEDNWTRAVGGMKVLGGAAETISGAGCVYATAGLGAIACGAIAAHGLDTVASGLKQVWTGEDERTLTARGVEGITGSRTAGDAVDLALGVGGSFAARGIAASAARFTKVTEAGDVVEMTRVTRWGKPGLRENDWVMVGEREVGNWFMSGKATQASRSARASFNAAETFEVPTSSLKTPLQVGKEGPFSDLIKTLYGQRIYKP